MPMELRKRKAPAAAPAPPPAPKRKAPAKKKEEPKPAAAEPSVESSAPKPVETKAPAAKKAAAPKKTAKAADKAEVTTEPPTTAAPVADAPKEKAKPKEKKEAKAPKAEAKKEDKPKATAAAKPTEKKEKEKEKEKEKPAEKKVETKEKDKKLAKAGASKSATATPAPPATSELKSGDPVPADLPDLSNQAGEKVTLPDLLAASKTGIVIFAYPKASTPGCTKQANFFNLSKDSFEAEGYAIYGLSGDKPERNAKFKESQKLTYPLLSDVTYGLHQKFGIANPAGTGTLRSVVIISKDGKIKAIKKAGPEETVKFARTACSLPAEDAKKGETSAAAGATSSKQPTVEEAPDVNA